MEGCAGSAVETETCNEGSCPTWSDWDEWSECTANCDGGFQSRSRQCENGEEEDCAGSATEERLCNQRSCDSREMVYWNDRLAQPKNGLILVKDEFLPPGETMMDRCVAYCLTYDGCIMTAVTRHEYIKSSTPVDWKCYIGDGDFISADDSWSNPSMYISYTIQFAVFRDYYEANPEFLYWDIDGTIGSVELAEVDGICDKTDTGFGSVNYRNTEGYAYTQEARNIIRESNSDNCAVKCFEKAGCSAFFVDDDGCTFVIGHTTGDELVKNDAVTDSGMLLPGVCPLEAFTNSFTLRSQFYCLLWYPDQAESITDRILQANAEADTPLRSWLFETRSNNPMITSSQYVNVEMPDMAGPDYRFRPVIFTIETHVRIEKNSSARKRRSADRGSEVIFVGEITEKLGEKFHKQAVANAEKTSKQRSIIPRTGDILDEIAAIDQQAISFVLDGGLELPDGAQVAATSPVEIVEFVQTTTDGSIAADCSSGTCQCSDGFVDNGNGCEVTNGEQVATTKVPATPAPTTTKAATTTTRIGSEPVIDFLESLIRKMDKVFYMNRPRRMRTQLLFKWTKLSNKFIQRYESVASKGCFFPDTFEDDTVDFYSVKTCRVSELT